MNSESQFCSNVLYQNTFLLFDPGSALERDNGLGLRSLGPWTVQQCGGAVEGLLEIHND